MAKGGKQPGAGRPAGTPNKSTTLAREAIARFVDDNTQRMQGWLDQIAQDSPEKAFNCVRDLMEYHLPKLARTEIKNPEGETFKTEQTISASDKAILERFQEQLLKAKK